MEKRNTLIVNLFGGPSTGKSSMSYGVTSKLKWRGIDAELAPEYAKIIAWENQRNKQRVFNPDGSPFLGKLENQFKVFGEQHDILFTLCGNVDVIITDSPILMQLCYSDNVFLNAAIIDEHKKFNTLDIFLIRKKPYNPNGRFQTKEQAIELDVKIKELIQIHSPNTYLEMDGVEENELPLAELIIDQLKNQCIIQ